MENDSVVVGEKTFVIGKPSPAQVAGIARAFARLNIGAKKVLSDIDKPTEMDYIMAFVASIDEATLIELAALSIGCDKKFAVENFDLIWVTNALSILIKKSNLTQVIANFTSILSPTVESPEPAIS